MSHPAPFAGFFSGAYKLLSVTAGQDIHTTNGGNPAFMENAWTYFSNNIRVALRSTHSEL